MTPPTSSTIDAKPRRDSAGGFSLIEMMLMLTILALLAALALPRARPFDSPAALRAKAYETAALLRSDRDAALRTDRAVSSVVDFGLRRVAAGATRDAVLLPDGMAMRLKADSFSGFRFFPDGRSTGGELTLLSGAAALVLRVDRLTSAVEIRPPGERAP